MGKIKNHFEKNKQLYIGIGVGVGVSVVSTLVLRQPKVVGTLSKNQITALLAWKPQQTLEVYIEALGDPGNVIQDLTTGTIYASQGQAARALNLSASAISKHLKGLTPHVKGHTFKLLGKAIAE